MDATRAHSGPGLQSPLYRAVADAPRVAHAELVPAETPPLREVIFEGSPAEVQASPRVREVYLGQA